MDKEKDRQLVKALKHMRLPKYEVIALKFIPKDKRDVKEFIGKEALIAHTIFGFRVFILEFLIPLQQFV